MGLIAVLPCSMAQEPVFPEPGEGETKSEGIINRIDENEVVINDMIYTFTTETEFYTSTMGKVNVTFFLKNINVGYIYNKKLEITSIWHMD
jgi:hypothetical protein